MVLTGNVAKRRRYTPRRPMSVDPDAPFCECGQYKREKTKGGFRNKCHRCRRNKAGSSAASQAATASSSDEESDAGPSQQQETPSNTLLRSSGSVLSPTPTVRGPRPSGSTWSGSAHVFTDPNTTRVRQQTARGGRGFSTLQQSWLTDFSWLRCEKDPSGLDGTDGRSMLYRKRRWGRMPRLHLVQSPLLRRMQKPDRQRLQRSLRQPDV